MQILGLLGMYFDAMVVEVEKEKNLLLFRLALAILCVLMYLLWISGFIFRISK